MPLFTIPPPPPPRVAAAKAFLLDAEHALQRAGTARSSEHVADAISSARRFIDLAERTLSRTE